MSSLKTLGIGFIIIGIIVPLGGHVHHGLAVQEYKTALKIGHEILLKEYAERDKYPNVHIPKPGPMREFSEEKDCPYPKWTYYAAFLLLPGLICFAAGKDLSKRIHSTDGFHDQGINI